MLNFPFLPVEGLHEFNLDWFLKKFNELSKEWDVAKAAWLALKEYVENFFDDLDVQEEINNKLDDMYHKGLLTDMVSTIISQGTLGNKGYDPSVSPVSYADKYIYYDNSFINVKKDSDTTNPNDCPAPVIIIQKELNYKDTDPVANENFKCGGGIYSELDVTGYTLNTQEAVTQNFSNIYAVNKSAQGGIFGSNCIGARNYIIDSDEVKSVGGNKTGCIDGAAMNYIPYQRGGYALGAEFDVFNVHNEGESPLYQANDYNVYTRPTTVLNVVGYGNTEPVTNAIAIGTVSSGANGFWSGIMVGGRAFTITTDGEKKSGVFGTTGVNFASWRPISNNTGGYGFSCIRTNHAVRHWDGIQPIKINSGNIIMYNRSNSESSCIFTICANNTADPTLVLASADVGSGGANTIENPTRTTKGFLRYNKSSGGVQLVADNSRLELSQRINGSLNGVVMDSSNFRPTTNGTKQLGNASNRWGSIYGVSLFLSGELNIDGVTLNKTQLTALKNLIN